MNDIEITFFPKSYLYYTANKPFWLVFTTKYMNFSRYYKGAFDPDIIICDSEGYPIQITNSSFEIIGISESDKANRGNQFYDLFMNVWEQAIPLTEEIYNDLYNI